MKFQGINPRVVYYDEASDVTPAMWRGIPIKMVESIRTRIPTEMWRILNSGGSSVKTPKPKRITKDEHIAELQRQKNELAQGLRDKTSDYNNLCQRLLDLQCEAKHLRKTNEKLIKKLTRKS
jgi:hypothetical protein